MEFLYAAMKLMVQHLFLHQNLKSKSHPLCFRNTGCNGPNTTSDTNLTLMRASRLAFFKSKYQ
jgi:hypothetical protein